MSTLQQFRPKTNIFRSDLRLLACLGRHMSIAVWLAERTGDEELIDELLRVKNRINKLLGNELTHMNRN